jgi:hypothetical protein
MPVLSSTLTPNRIAVHYLNGVCEVALESRRSMGIVRVAEAASQLQTKGFTIGQSELGSFDTLGGAETGFLVSDLDARAVKNPGGVRDNLGISDTVTISQKQFKVVDFIKTSDSVTSKVTTRKTVLIVDTIKAIESVTATHS